MNLDRASRYRIVLSAFGAKRHFALDLYHPLVPQPLGHAMRVGRELRVEDDLRQPVSVADVYEDQRAVVAAAVNPARQGNGLSGVFGA